MKYLRQKILAVSLLSLSVFLWSSQSIGEVKGFDQQSFEVYFQRANQELNAQNWEQVARSGADFAIAAWEQKAQDLYTDAQSRDQARASVEAWASDEITARYQTWLQNRFLSSGSAFDSDALAVALQQARLTWLYETDSTGHIVVDAQGDPVLKVKQDVSTDRQAVIDQSVQGWHDTLQTTIDTVVQDWDQRTSTGFAPELGSLLGPDAQVRYADYIANRKDGYRRELENVALQGELGVQARLSYDQYSLRKKSESQTADAIVKDLINQTKASTDQGIADIRTSLDLHPGQVDGATPDIQADQWLASFRQAFEKGLNSWDTAESTFLTNRAEWDQTAGKTFQDGEAAWAAAFQKLRTERQNWQNQVDAILQQGRATWQLKSADLTSAIAAAQTQFQQEAQARSQALADRVGAEVTMYAQSLQVTAQAKAAGQNLMKDLDLRTSQGDYVVFGADSGSVLASERQTSWNAYQSVMQQNIAQMHNDLGVTQQDQSNYQTYLADIQREYAYFFQTTKKDFTGKIIVDPSGSMNDASIPSWLSTYTGGAGYSFTNTSRYTYPRNYRNYQLSVNSQAWYDSQILAVQKHIADDAQSVLDQTNAINQANSLKLRMASANPAASLSTPSAAFTSVLTDFENFLKGRGSSDVLNIQVKWDRLDSAGSWLDTVTTYSAQADAAKTKLQDALGFALGPQSADLRDVLQTDATTGLVYIDEYQLELLRAKTVADYWNEQKKTADAVVAYAADITSGRTTQAEGDAAYKAASSAYQTAAAQYQAVQDQLKASGQDLATAKTKLDSAQTVLKNAVATLDAVRQTYLDALVASQDGKQDFYRDQIDQKYQDLLQLSGKKASNPNDPPDLVTATADYLAAERQAGISDTIGNSWSLAKDLIQGNADKNMVSLATLKTTRNQLQAPVDADHLPALFTDLHIDAQNPAYQTILSLFNNWKSLSDTNQKNLAGRVLQASLVSVQDQAQAALDSRIDAISALGALNAADWYTQSGGSLAGRDPAQAVADDVSTAQFANLKERAELEKRGLQNLAARRANQIPPYPNDAAAVLLADTAPASSTLSDSELAARISILDQVLAAVGTGQAVDYDAISRSLHTVAANQPWAAQFLNGQGSFVDSQAGDLGSLLCVTSNRAVLNAQARANAFQGTASLSPALALSNQNAVLSDVASLCREAGLTVANGAWLPSVSDLVQRLDQAQNAAELVRFAASLDQKLQNSAANGPRWIQDRVGEWCHALQQYTAAQGEWKFTTSVASAQSQYQVAVSDVASSRTKQDALQQDLSLIGSQGTQLTALKDLYNMGGTGSISQSELGDLAVQVGASLLAQRYQADQTIDLSAVAQSLCAGMPSTIVNGIVSTVQSWIQKSQGSTSYQALVNSYQQWNSLSPQAATASISPVANRSAYSSLWAQVMVPSFASDADRNTAIDNYLQTTYTQQSLAVPPSILSLCNDLKSFPANRGSLFTTAIFGSGMAVLQQNLASMGTAGDVYQNAVALHIIQQASNQSDAEFLLDAAGIARPAQLASLVGTSFDLNQTSFQMGSLDAQLYLAKTLLISGKVPPPALLGSLQSDSVSANALADFENQLATQGAYIESLDGPVGDYAQNQTDGLTNQSQLMPNLATKSFDDPLFASFASDTLSWLGQRASQKAAAGLSLVQTALSQAINEQSQQTQILITSQSYWTALSSAASAAGSSSWRVALNQGVTTKQTGTSNTQSIDPADGFLLSNAQTGPLLDAYNELTRCQNLFQTALGLSAVDATSLDSYHQFIANILDGTASVADAVLPSTSVLSAKQNTYQSVLAQIASDESDLGRYAGSLQLLTASSADQTAQLGNLKSQVDLAEKAQHDQQDAVQKALETFNSAGDSYNGIFAGSQTAWDALDAARQNLRTQEEIQNWAASGYLNATNESSADYQSPVDRQTTVTQTQARANAALDVLKNLYGQAPTAQRTVGNNTYETAYQSWKAASEDSLRLSKAQGTLESALDLEQQKVDEKNQAFQSAQAGVMSARTILSELGTDWNSFHNQTDIAKKSIYYLVLKDGQVELNYDSNMKLVAMDSVQWQALVDYFSKTSPGNGAPDGQEQSDFDRQLQDWTLSFSHYAQQAGGPNALIQRWSRAAEYVKTGIAYGNGGVLFKDLLDQKTHYFDGDGNLNDPAFYGKHYDNNMQDCINETIAENSQIATSVFSSPEESKAFQFFMAMMENGAVGSAGLRNEYENAGVAACLVKVTDYFNRTAGDFAHGWLNEIWHSGEIDSCHYFASKAYDKLQNLNLWDGATFQNALTNRNTTRTGYYNQAATLADLSGADNTPISSLSDFKQRYLVALAASTGKQFASVSIDTQLNQQFDAYWDHLSDTDKTSFSKVLGTMTRLADADQAYAKSTVAIQIATAQSAQIAAQTTYQTAFDDYLAGKTTLAALTSAASTNYQYAQWSARSDELKQNGLFQELAFGGGDVMSQAESDARTPWVQQYAQSISQAFQGALDAKATIRQNQWSQTQTDLQDRISSWNAQVSLINAKALSAWDASTTKLAQAQATWETGFKREYQDKSDAWNVAWLNFNQQKSDWVNATRQKAASVGNQSILEDVGASADDASRQASTLLIGSISFDASAATNEVNNLLQSIQGASAIAGLQRVVQTAKNFQTSVHSGALGADTGSASIELEVQNFIAQSHEELAKHAANDMAASASDSIVQAQKQVVDTVAQANQNFDQQMQATFTNAGYTRNGNQYQRQAVVGSNLWGLEKDTQSFEGYRFFQITPIKLTIDLNPQRLAGLDSGSVMDLIGMAEGQIASIQKKIFGTSDTDKGDFGNWIGESPTFKDTPDYDQSASNNLASAGSGELGRLMTQFQWNEMKEGKGLSGLAKPSWDQPLWDDRGSPLKALSFRSASMLVATIAQTIVSKIPIIGTAISFAIGVVNAAQFMLLDGVSGNKSWADAGLEFGKQVAISGLTAITGGPVAIALQSAASVVSVVAQAAIAAGTMAATSAINAFHMDGSKLSWSTSEFLDNTFNTDNLGSLASTAIGGLVTQGMGALNMTDGLGKSLNGGIFNTKSISALNGMVGSLTGQGANALITGKSTFNLLNLKDIVNLMGGGDNADMFSSGLFEMHFGGGRPSFEFGTGGADVSVSGLSGAVAGMRDADKVMSAKTAMLGGDMRGISTLNMINALAYDAKNAANIDLANKLWKGQVTAKYSSLPNAYGQYDSKSPNEILISDKLLGNSSQTAVDLATVAAHEGVHQAGDRIEADAYNQGMRTWSTLTAAYGTDKSSDMLTNMLDALQNPSNYVANSEGTADNWLVKNDHSIVDDRKDGQINFEDGRPSVNTKNQTKQGSLEEFLTLGPRKASGTLDAAGFLYDKGWQADGKTISAQAVNNLLAENGKDPSLVLGPGPNVFQQLADGPAWAYHGVTTGGLPWVGEQLENLVTSTKAKVVAAATPVVGAIGTWAGDRLNDIGSAWNSLWGIKPASMPDIGQNLSQEYVEDQLGIDRHNACAVTSYAWMNNQYYIDTLGAGLNSNALIQALRNSKGTAFDNQATVKDGGYTFMGSEMAKQKDVDSYLVWAADFNSLSDLQGAGYKYYLQKFTLNTDATETHFFGWDGQVFKDPDTTTNNRWWEKPAKVTSFYRAFIPIK